MSRGAYTAAALDLLVQWQADAALQASLNDALDAIGFTARYVEEAKRRRIRKRKAIKDSIWGMIEFPGTAMHLIDSPLVQRLRSVHQLGFSYLTYPTAEHSRFAHSLGMANVVGRFVDSIGKARDADDAELSGSPEDYATFDSLKPLTRDELVSAAILHDVGHFPFSHATESAVGKDEDGFTCGHEPLADVLSDARGRLQKKISISELISILIVLSERFEAFAEPLFPGDTRASLARIACLIAGVQTLDACPNIHEIISSAAVDADKIDYVSRDARGCGISVGVDVARIFLGTAVIRASREIYDQTYRGDEKNLLFVLNSSGADTLDEIIQARTALFQRVYLHPVTRTAEAILARMLRLNLKTSEPLRDAGLGDVLALWGLSDHKLLERLSGSGVPEISDLADRIKLRELPKKACAIASAIAHMQTPVGDLFRNLSIERANRIRKNCSNAFIEQLTLSRIEGEAVTAFEDAVREEALRIAALLKSKGTVAAAVCPDTPLGVVVLIPIQDLDYPRPDAIVFQNGEIIKTPTVTNVQGQHDALDLFKAVGYVMCDPDWRALVLLACRRVIYQLSLSHGSIVEHDIEAPPPHQDNKPRTTGGLRTEVVATSRVRFRPQTIIEHEGAVRRSGLRRSHADALMRAAQAAGYFSDCPLLALRQDPRDSLVIEVARRFKPYDGEGGWTVTRDTVAAFIDQFPPELRRPMLEQLNRGTFLGQAELAQYLCRALAQIPAATLDTAILVPLSPSSGGPVHAILRSAQQLSSLRFHLSVREALHSSDGRLLLVDDNASSGVQASAQLYSLCNVSRDSRPEKLRRETNIHEEELTPDEIDDLKARLAGIVVAVGMGAANDRVTDAARTLGFRNFEGLKYGEPIVKGELWPSDLEAWLRPIGRDLIAFRDFGVSFADLSSEENRAFCNSREFGYSNVGGIMTTHSNVPTSSVTALWHPGIYHGRPWMPLFIRRGRLQDVVVA